VSRRFAVYYAPPPGSALEAFGRAWLGRDHATGESLEQPQIEGLPPQRLREITSAPRHYGFHATLKAPFRLNEGLAPEDLHLAVRDVAGRAPFVCSPLEVSTISGFIACTLSFPCANLEKLAAACVDALEPFRAPLSDEEIARRRQSGLTARQDAYLRAWGYPYVFEEFRFHMTLTDRLEEPERSRVLAILRGRFETFAGTPLNVDAIAIYEQADRGRPFLMSARYPLGGAPDPARQPRSAPRA
jgi:putative phosphonate metabolism protein